MIKIKFEEELVYKTNPDIGMYALPKVKTTKKIYFLGIKIYDIVALTDNDCKEKNNNNNNKKVGF